MALRTLVDRSPMGFAVGDFTDGSVYVNRRAADLLGCPSYGMSTEEWVAAVPTGDRARLRDAIFGTADPSCALRHRLGDDDTDVRCIEQTVTPVRNDDGTATGFVSVLTDATAHCQASEQLDASEDLIAGLVDTVGAIVLVLDARGRVRGVNAACEAITGVPAADLIGRPIIDTLVPEDQRGAAREAWEALTTGVTAHALETEIDTEGGRRLVSWTTTVLKASDGSDRAIIAAGVDITDQRALEQRLAQLDRLDSVGRVAAGIAHDFASTLAVLQLRTDRLAARGLDEHSRDDIAVLRRTIDRSRNLISDLLTFSRQENVGSTVIDANAEVTRTMKLLADLLEGISIEMDLADAAPRVVLDPARFGQILTNLALNARDSMRAGGRLTVTTTGVTIGEQAGGPVELPGGRFLRLSVTDNGAGIEPAHLAHVFEPYFTTKPAGEGTGLGLATVHGIVTRSGGAVTVESDPGRGSTFDVWLPAHVADEGSSAPADRTGPDVASAAGRPHAPESAASSRGHPARPARSDGQNCEAAAGARPVRTPHGTATGVADLPDPEIVEFCDVTSHEEANARYGQTTIPLGRGPLRIRNVAVELGDVSVESATAGAAVLERYSGPQGTTVIGITKPGAHAPIGFLGADLPPLALPILRPGASYEHVLPACAEVLHVNLPNELVHSLGLEPLLDPEIDVLAADPASVAELVQAVDELVSGRSRSRVDEARTRLLHLVTNIVHEPAPVSSPHDAMRRHVLYVRTIELLEAELGDSSADEISRLMAVPLPMLDEAFRHALGISLTSYIARRRLLEVRRRLQDTNHDWTVAEILRRSSALDHFELRRQYRQLFGESPSRTRRRSTSATTDVVRGG